MERELTPKEKEQRRKLFWQDYEKYLLTDNWLKKREAVLRRDSFQCQGCLLQEATQVHHLTYKHLYREFLFELISLCGKCHKRIGKKILEREIRSAEEIRLVNQLIPR